MRKKDYELIAGAIKSEVIRYAPKKDGIDHGFDCRRALFNCANELGKAFQKNDTRFKRTRFMIDCGIMTCRGNHKTKSELFACADCNVIIDGDGGHV